MIYLGDLALDLISENNARFANTRLAPFFCRRRYTEKRRQASAVSKHANDERERKHILGKPTPSLKARVW